jgi:hypothetical protein
MVMSRATCTLFKKIWTIVTFNIINSNHYAFINLNTIIDENKVKLQNSIYEKCTLIRKTISTFDRTIYDRTT